MKSWQWPTTAAIRRRTKDGWIVSKDKDGKDVPFTVSYKLEKDKDGHPTGATTYENSDSTDPKSPMVEKFQYHPDARLRSSLRTASTTRVHSGLHRDSDSSRF